MAPECFSSDKRYKGVFQNRKHTNLSVQKEAGAQTLLFRFLHSAHFKVPVLPKVLFPGCRKISTLRLVVNASVQKGVVLSWFWCWMEFDQRKTMAWLGLDWLKLTQCQSIVRSPWQRDILDIEEVK
jgi:hypothetical protein